MGRRGVCATVRADCRHGADETGAELQRDTLDTCESRNSEFYLQG